MDGIQNLRAPVSVSNLGKTGTNTVEVGQFLGSNYKYAGSFTTGSSSNEYTVESATIRVATVFLSPTLSMAVQANNYGNPAAQATHTLTGTSPTAAGDVTYTCSGSCVLKANTTYFLVISATVSAYQIQLTDSGDETNTPSDAGWSIADVTKNKVNNDPWGNYPVNSALALMFKVTAMKN